jgi:hypothetical protein
MSLDNSKLERVTPRVDGSYTARCPACGETGGDARGENHLIVYDSGKFGCCARPKDREHRRRIFQLAGIRKAKSVQARPLPLPRVNTPPTPKQADKSLLDSLTGRFSDVSDGSVRITRVKRDVECEYVKRLGTTRPTRPTPYRTPDGTLVIPFDCPDRFHWWKPGSMRLSDIDREFPFESN